MQMNDTARLYAALKAKDARFDGRFFVGITSTGIYCRPVCRAKSAKEENCVFFRSSAEAERAGFRPCLKCRPELAPQFRAENALARRAARLMDENIGGVSEISARLGCTDRHLRRVFAEEYGVSPVQYLQTRRLLLAKELLTDTSLSVLDVAMAAGFGSLRRFNALFRRHYRLSPSALRKRAPAGGEGGRDIALSLTYRPPYRWDALLGALEKRAIAGIECVRDGEYFRTVEIAGADGKPVRGWLRVAHLPRKNALGVTLCAALLPVLPQVLARVRDLFDLHCDPDAICEALEPMNELRPGLFVRGTRLPGCFDAFEMAVRTVLGQQITLKAASTLAQRIVAALGEPIDTGVSGLTHIFPSARTIAALESAESALGPLGVIATRSRTISAFANALLSGEIELSGAARPEEEMVKLLEIPGVGPWTAKYIAMRAMGWPDAFLETDAGVKKALAPLSASEMVRLAESWRPWRSYATISLWNSL